MPDEEQPKMLHDLVKNGEPPLTDAYKDEIRRMRVQLRISSTDMARRLQEMDLVVDAGLEAVHHLRWFLMKIGILSEDQYVAAEASWEAEYHNQLRTLLQQATGPKLFIPGKG